MAPPSVPPFQPDARTRGDWCCWERRRGQKATQAELLTERLGACHLSTETVSRRQQAQGLRPISGNGSRARLHAPVELVPDSTVWEMVRERSHCILGCGGFILRRFPRTLGQA